MTIAKLIIGSVLALLLASGCLASEALPEEWPCKSNADCLAGEKCFDPRDGDGERCKRATFCLLETDCAADDFCAFGSNTCTRAACTTDSQCGPFKCNATAFGDNPYECHTSCTSAYQCAFPFECIGGTCVASQCTVGDPSPCLGYACLSPGVCGTSCTSAAECAPNWECIDNACVDPCDGLECGYAGALNTVHCGDCLFNEQCSSNQCVRF
ncbi:MAG TPA: hypothetical protein VM686_13060 [Polyangiaceae bacterium]|nr:hypothetical protein [Polyangiaceae bacterium]